ncbi:unnamed protein product [Sphagnum jensenii]
MGFRSTESGSIKVPVAKKEVFTGTELTKTDTPDDHQTLGPSSSPYALQEDISPDFAKAIEEKAMAIAWAFESRAGRLVEDVSIYTCGYDLKSTKGDNFKAIEVKGKLTSGQVILTANEWRAAGRIGSSYYLYVVEDLSSKNPTLKIVQDPAKALQPDQSKMQFVLPRSAYISADQIIELASGVNSN